MGASCSGDRGGGGGIGQWFVEAGVGAKAKNDLPVLGCASQDEWNAWLAVEHARSNGVWLKIAKKAAGTRSVSYQEALDVALCFGWIDGQKRALDEQFWLQRFTPRRTGSRWSQINRDRVGALLQADRMQPAGLREVERAQANGAWDAAYAGQRAATVPADLQVALEMNPAADRLFRELDSANRYAIVYRVQDAKLPATRARRIEQLVTMLSEGRKLHP